MSCIGYYVHHQGIGHEHRFRAIAAAAPDIDIVPISERSIEGGVLLSSDVPAITDGPADDPTAGGRLHWAPLHPATATRRLKTIIDWLHEARPSGVVVDVSVEIVLACRLAGVPTVAVRQHGDRTDPAHALAFGSARRLMAPFPAEFETSADAGVIDKTDHLGFVRPPPTVRTGPDGMAKPGVDAPLVSVTASDVVVLWGRGGGRLSGRRLDAIASVTTGRVFCAGVDIWNRGDPPSSPRVVDLGWVESPQDLLGDRPVVVGSCGNNTVGIAAAHGCPFVAVPQPRPFDEQVRLAEAMAAAGVVTIAPEADDVAGWRDTIDQAIHRSARWADLHDPFGGASVAADVIRRWLT